MSLVSDLNGQFSLSELERLKFPVAWSGTKPESEQEAEETALHALAREAIGQLQEAYNHTDLEEGQELEIKIVDGEISEIVEV
jgi:hypothetical protein